MTTNTLNPEHNDTQILARTSDFSTRLSIPAMKKQLIKQDVLDDMIKISKTGLRIRVDEFGKQMFDDEHRALFDSVSTKDLIDVQKFLVSRILPPCKEQAEVSTDYSEWQEHIQSVTSPVSDLSPGERDARAAKAKADAIARSGGGPDDTTTE